MTCDHLLTSCIDEWCRHARSFSLFTCVFIVVFVRYLIFFHDGSFVVWVIILPLGLFIDTCLSSTLPIKEDISLITSKRQSQSGEKLFITNGNTAGVSQCWSLRFRCRHNNGVVIDLCIRANIITSTNQKYLSCLHRLASSLCIHHLPTHIKLPSHICNSPTLIY